MYGLSPLSLLEQMIAKVSARESVKEKMVTFKEKPRNVRDSVSVQLIVGDVVRYIKEPSGENLDKLINFLSTLYARSSIEIIREEEDLEIIIKSATVEIKRVHTKKTAGIKGYVSLDVSNSSFPKSCYSLKNVISSEKTEIMLGCRIAQMFPYDEVKVKNRRKFMIFFMKKNKIFKVHLSFGMMEDKLFFSSYRSRSEKNYKYINLSQTSDITYDAVIRSMVRDVEHPVERSGKHLFLFNDLYYARPMLRYLQTIQTTKAFDRYVAVSGELGLSEKCSAHQRRFSFENGMLNMRQYAHILLNKTDDIINILKRKAFNLLINMSLSPEGLSSLILDIGVCEIYVCFTQALKAEFNYVKYLYEKKRTMGRAVLTNQMLHRAVPSLLYCAYYFNGNFCFPIYTNFDGKSISSWLSFLIPEEFLIPIPVYLNRYSLFVVNMPPMRKTLEPEYRQCFDNKLRKKWKELLDILDTENKVKIHEDVPSLQFLAFRTFIQPEDSSAKSA